MAVGGVTVRTGTCRGRQDSVRPAAAEITVAVTVVRRRRTRLLYNIKRLISVNNEMLSYRRETALQGAL